MSRKPRKQARASLGKRRASGGVPYVPSPTEDVPLTVKQACAFLAGDGRPIDPSTYYRGVKAGRFPKPFRVSPNVSRVMRSALERAREVLASQSTT
jgi:predicted DNA-binding transcriptional regulator AlpA